MIRTPSGNVRSLYRPKLQNLPRWMNVHFHWYELNGSEKPKRAAFIAVAWFTRHVSYNVAHWGCVGSIVVGLLVWGGFLDLQWLVFLGGISIVAATFFMTQEVTSALVRGREFRFENENPNHMGAGDLTPRRVQVVNDRT